MSKLELLFAVWASPIYYMFLLLTDCSSILDYAGPPLALPSGLRVNHPGCYVDILKLFFRFNKYSVKTRTTLPNLRRFSLFSLLVVNPFFLLSENFTNCPDTFHFTRQIQTFSAVKKHVRMAAVRYKLSKY